MVKTQQCFNINIGNRLLSWRLVWLLSSYNWNSSNSNVFNVNGSDNPGNLNNNNVNNSNAVRPVISLVMEIFIANGYSRINFRETSLFPQYNMRAVLSYYILKENSEISYDGLLVLHNLDFTKKDSVKSFMEN